MSEGAPNADAKQPPKWKPIGRIERRVLGVLVEKAKTTPDAYPLTLNSLTTGCNQKSNRDPQMNLNPDDVETALEKLRHMSAVIEVSGGGRVPKYRHMLYEWLGVDKTEAAVMTELLLRGPQTVGELRGRAARMEPIADVNALQPVLQSLIEKRLVISLTAAGRGQTVCHALFLPEEMNKVRSTTIQDAATTTHPAAVDTPVVSAASSAPTPGPASSSSSSNPNSQDLAQLRDEVEQLKSEVTRLKNDLQDVWANLNR